MKFGTVSLWKESAQDFIDEVRLAQSCGSDLVAVGDSQSLYRELYVSLTVAALETSTCLIGPMVSNPVTRHPAVAVSAMASLDQLSNGRAVFGIGTGGSSLWALNEPSARISHLRDYLTTFNALQRSGLSEWNGREIRVDIVERAVPVFVSAEGPRSLELAGALADAVILHTGTSPEAISWCRSHIARGAAAVGRDPSTISLWMMLKAGISDDRERALSDARVGLAGSARHALNSNAADKGVPPDLLEPVHQLVERYDTRTHAMAGSNNADLVDELGLTEFLGDHFGLIGTAAECAAKATALEALGIKGLLVPVIGTKETAALIERLYLQVMPMTGRLIDHT